MSEPRSGVAVVTGAASGIGLALSRALTERGAPVMMADVEAGPLQSAAEALAASGARVSWRRCDVTNAEDVSGLAEATVRELGPVDLLINNAGVGGALGPIWDTHPDDWTWTFGVNVQGVVNGVRAFTPAMIAQARGHVVNVASLAGLSSPPFLSPYVASKHAVVALSEVLAQELQVIGSPVRVSVVCPGVVTSGITRSERNRPEALSGSVSTSAEQLARIQAAFDERMETPMPADAFAAEVLRQLDAGAFMVLTHPESASVLGARLQSFQRALSVREAA